LLRWLVCVSVEENDDDEIIEEKEIGRDFHNNSATNNTFARFYTKNKRSDGVGRTQIELNAGRTVRKKGGFP